MSPYLHLEHHFYQIDLLLDKLDEKKVLHGHLQPVTKLWVKYLSHRVQGTIIVSTGKLAGFLIA